MAKRKKNIPINYTSRDFASIREDLIQYARRYYPNTFQDFNEAGFGSLTFDTVAYVGDILSFYLDYQANESFLDTAIEYDSVLRLGKQLGYKLKGRGTSHGIASFYAIVPASYVGGGPDLDYAPVLKPGTTVGTDAGVNFVLTEEVVFSDPLSESTSAEIDPTNGNAISYVIKAKGSVASGEFMNSFIEVGDYQRFYKTTVDDENFVEVISVFDEEGNE